jgi:hypothetical protein
VSMSQRMMHKVVGHRPRNIACVTRRCDLIKHRGVH